MLKFIFLLGNTITLRPYVFIFLSAYLLLATLHLGAGRTLAFLVLGYLIAWMAEFSAINWGFPFGEYIYIPATVDQELWVAGVPFMDSLSYVFLAYASFSMALLALGRGRWQGCGYLLEENPKFLGSWRVLILAAVLMVALDVVIDPLALRGYRWFLRQIYGYPKPGVYFGITLANFGGWLLVGLVMIRVLQLLISSVPDAGWSRGRRDFPCRALLGPGLYLGILGFNLCMTFWIGETCLGWVGVFIYAPFLTWLGLKVFGKDE
ncbi:MAG: carotenoid biosynthesis protein [Deltaproteobacteria bacterium]|nr:carotenoid biosynthesis protein [Deltaproteobacteria bacterium]